MDYDVAYVLPEDLKLGETYRQRSLVVVDRQLDVTEIRLDPALLFPSDICMLGG